MYDLSNLFEDVNNFFYGNGGYRTFPIDLVEVEDGFNVIAELPGVKREDISISFEDGVMTIVANRQKDAKAKYLINERDTTRLKRSINFGEINEESITAKLEDGILSVFVKTKALEEKKAKKVVIE